MVACGVTVTNYRDGDSSFFAIMNPRLYMVRTKDDHGVLLKVPRACQGQTTDNGRVPKDFLPGILWFEDADNWLEATGYFSELAYENPNARLAFHGASVHPASRAEWEEWRETGEARNLVPPHMPPRRGIAQDVLREREKTWTTERWAREYYGPIRSCRGALRFELTEPMQEVVRDYWPAERPRYWAPTTEEHEEIRRRFLRLSPGYDPVPRTRIAGTRARRAMGVIVTRIGVK